MVLSLTPDTFTNLVLTAAALLTTILSGVIGQGGGMILLAVLFAFTDNHAEVICLHAFVQMIANGTRVLGLVRHIDWPTVTRFTLGALPGTLIGGLVLLGFGGLEANGRAGLRVGIGVYVFAVLLMPRRAAHEPGRWHFPVGGLITGAMAPVVGATGPMLASVFAVRNFTKERLVATLSQSNLILHPLKFVAFWLMFRAGGGDQPDWGSLVQVGALMALMAVIGTGIGHRILKETSDKAFRWLYFGALAGSGAKILIWDGLRPLFGW